ncbi:MAG: tRNA (N(6)-L-threonylcarbamoyladenosine(37)-C(2))-methylthiotransferase MtaB [Gammaproteobacteria bacterium]
MNSVYVNLPAERRSVEPDDLALPVRKVAISTLGCKVNTFESELIAQKLSARHCQRVTDTETADLVVINTCTVTAEADRQARQQVRRTIRANPGAKVVVTGCYAQVDPQACSQIPGVDLVVGNSGKLDIPALIEPLFAGELPPVMVDNVDAEISLPDQLVSGFEGRTRAFVQIQQGCDQGCTFCIIHTARGPNRSFAPALIKTQVERLVNNGYQEIVICGVDIGSYGNDFAADFDLADLLAQLTGIPEDFRIRLSSLDPAHITDQLIRVMTFSDKVCPQLHLSLQSGNTLILKRMKRRATREVLYERIGAIRRVIPELVLSADILVGFPTETEDHFAQTLGAVYDLEVAFPHVFPYSIRPGTPAARIPDQVPVSERKSRADRIRSAGREVWKKVAESMIGTTQRVLVEGRPAASEQSALARAANYFVVQVDPAEIPASGWQKVEITGIDGDSLIARRSS